MPRATGGGDGSLTAIPSIHQFLLAARGRVVWRDGHSYTSFDIPNGIGTFAYAIDDAGYVAGTFIGGPGGDEGFLRAPNGAVTLIEPPGLSP
ncbi:MAG TPA: hypothetical protein VID19_05245, partial [Candidatus Eremiobacteraceae bacterium]